jgi:hypothetical protein
MSPVLLMERLSWRLSVRVMYWQRRRRRRATCCPTSVPVAAHHVAPCRRQVAWLSQQIDDSIGACTEDNGDAAHCTSRSLANRRSCRMYQHSERQSREENNSPVGELAKEPCSAWPKGGGRSWRSGDLKTVLTVSTCAEPVNRPNRLYGS